MDRPWLKSILSAALSGLLLVTIFPRWNQHLVAWAALVPLLWVLHTQRPRVFYLSAYVMGVAYLGLLLHWILLVRWPAQLGYAIGVFVLPLLFLAWAVAVRKGLTGNIWVALLLPPAAWAGLEFLSALGPWGFTWWHLGYSQAGNLWVAQLVEITGVYGVSFLIVLVNNAAALALLGRFRGSPARWLAPGLVLVCLGFGAVRLTGDFQDREQVKIALIQGNITQEAKEEALAEDRRDTPLTQVTPSYSAEEIFEIHMIESLRAARLGPDMIVWPETMISSPFLEYEPFRTRINMLAGDSGAYLLLGMFEYISDTEQRNSVVLIEPGQGPTATYSKMQLVPFGEYLPMRRFFYGLGLRDWIDANIYSTDVTPGSEQTLFETDRGRFGVVICFESIIPGLSRKLTLGGAELLFVITNDAWFERSPAAEQHMAMAAIRAVENRRWVVQSANTGISGFADPKGRMLRAGGLMTREIITFDAGFREGMTFYTRVGDLFAWLCLIGVALQLAGSVVVRLRVEADPIPAPRPPADDPKS